MIVSGVSRSGKTDFVIRLLHNLDTAFYEGRPAKILYCYKRMQDKLFVLEKDVPGLVLHEGLPSSDTLDEFSSSNKGELLVILDDLIFLAVNSATVADLFTSGRHSNISIIFITQNIFEKGLYSRTITLNAMYIVLFNNIRDRTQISRFASQVYQQPRLKDFMRIYDTAMLRQFNYLLMDFHPYSDNTFRLRNNLLGELGEEINVFEITEKAI